MFKLTPYQNSTKMRLSSHIPTEIRVLLKHLIVIINEGEGEPKETESYKD